MYSDEYLRISKTIKPNKPQQIVLHTEYINYRLIKSQHNMIPFLQSGKE